MPQTKIKDDQVDIVTAVNGFIEVPTAKSYVLSLSIPFAGTLVKLVAKSTNASASGTLVININSTGATFTGGTFSISGTTEKSDTFSANKAFVVGDTLAIAITSPSDLDDLAFTLEYER